MRTIAIFAGLCLGELLSWAIGVSDTHTLIKGCLTVAVTLLAYHLCPFWKD